ncbi:MAG: cell wall hydrolase [Parvularcula sp.]|jgi:hypothetical protein|nr:cell wall hydrolase [Parvularcula sp.]
MQGQDQFEGTRAWLIAIFVMMVAALVLLMVRRDAIGPVAERLDYDIFMVAAETPVEPQPVVSAVQLLNEAGFDGTGIAADLVLSGIARQSFALAGFRSDPVLTEEQAKQRHCLTQAIYYEARNQPVLGQIAVADVVLNRVKDRQFPSTICRVVFQGKGRSYACQFSFACDGSLNRPREPRAWEQAEKLADLIYRGFQPELTRFATYYHADYVSPPWARQFDQTARIGDHIFYRPQGALKLAANEAGVKLPLGAL